MIYGRDVEHTLLRQKQHKGRQLIFKDNMNLCEKTTLFFLSIRSTSLLLASSNGRECRFIWLQGGAR